MGTRCQACEVGKWKGEIGVNICKRCDSHLKGSTTVRNGTMSEAECICPKGYYDAGQGECVAIGEGEGIRDDVEGMTLRNLFLEEAFWRTGENSTEVRECPPRLAKEETGPTTVRKATEAITATCARRGL